MSEPPTDYINCLRTLSSLDRKGFVPHISDPNLVPFGELQDHPAYKQWLGGPKGSDRTLWIHGEKGSGRSVLASWAAKLASTSIDNAVIISFTFNSKDDRYRSTCQMYASLSHQLLCLRPLLFSHVSLLYKQIMNATTDGPKLKLDRLWSLFRSLLSCPRHGETICIINDIDECKPSRTRFLEDLFQMPKCTGSTFRLVLTSVTKSEQHVKVPPANRIDLEANLKRGKEIESVVKSDILDLVKRRPLYRKFDGKISEIVCRPTVALHEARLSLTLLNVIEIRSTYSAVEQALNSIPKTEFGIHQRLLSQVLGRDSEIPRLGLEPAGRDSDWAIRALSWISNAFRPLTLAEISEALAFEDEMNKNSLSNIKAGVLMDPTSDLRCTFGWLIEIKNDEVFFAHKSWHDHLIDQLNGHSEGNRAPTSDYHVVMARSCLTYLSLMSSPSRKALLPNAAEMSPGDLVKYNHGLLPYAVQYWPSHYHKATLDDAARQNFQQFFKNKELVELWSEMFWEYQNPLTRRAAKDPLSIAAEVGCGDLVDALLENCTPNVGECSVALGVAIEAGHESLVEKLLAFGARNTRALHSAAAYGRDSIVPKLIKQGFATGDPEKSDSTPLHVAAGCGSLGVVERLLAEKEGSEKGGSKKEDSEKEGSKIEAKTNEGLTPLHLASQFGHVDVIRRLLDAEADQSAVSGLGATPLHLACEWQQPGAVEALLDSQAKIGSIDNHKKTPLHLAARTGRVDIVGMLLEKASDPNMKDELLESQDDNGMTPLHVAADFGHPEVVSELLAQTERTPGATGVKNSQGRVPLHLGASNGHLGVVESLINRSSEQIEATDESSSNPIHMAVQRGHFGVVSRICEEHKRQGYSLDVFNSSTLTPLHLACEKGDSAIVKKLLLSGAQAEITGVYNETPLHTPLHISCSKGFLDITSMLIRFGANPTATTSAGSTPLHFASENGSVEVVKKVAFFMYHVNVKDNKGRLPIHLAAHGGHYKVIKVLRDKDADLDGKDFDGRTILHYACEGGSIEFVKELLDGDFGGDVDVKDNEDRTPLHVAAGAGQFEIVKELMNAGAESGAVDKNNHTPLELANDERVIEELLRRAGKTLDASKIAELILQAARKGYGGVIKKLLEMDGSSPNVIGDDGKTALAIAAGHGHLKVVQQLLQAEGVESERADEFGRTPVSYAAENGHVTVLSQLLGYEGGNPNSMDNGGRSPTSYAAENGYDAAIKVLADLRAAVDARGMESPTPLWIAANKGHHETVELLLRCGADPNFADDQGRTGLHMAARNGYSKVATAILRSRAFTSGNTLDNEQSTAMYMAAYYGHVDTLAVLLEMELDKEIPGPRGWRPLHAAYDSLPIIRLLLNANAEKDAVNRDGETALSMAITGEYEDVTEELLNNGADPLIPDQDKSTPLHKAARTTSIRLIHLILRFLGSRDINIQDDRGQTPFLEAVRSGRVETVRAFLDRGSVDIHAVTKDNHTVLRAAIEGKHDKAVEMVKILLQELEKSNSTTGCRTSEELAQDLLLHAAARGNSEVLEILWKRVENADATDERFFNLAIEGNDWLAGFLLSQNADVDRKDEHGWTLGWIAFSNMSKDGKSRAKPRELPECEFLYPTSWSGDDKSEDIKFMDKPDATPRLHIRFGEDEPETCRISLPSS
jgi:ankyrin repeat protein